MQTLYLGSSFQNYRSSCVEISALIKKGTMGMLEEL